jgi:hypothetical protein
VKKSTNSFKLIKKEQTGLAAVFATSLVFAGIGLNATAQAQTADWPT